jgi:hypothetical protein
MTQDTQAARQVLLDLAARCEREEPSDELNWSIMEAVRPDHGQTQATQYGHILDAAVTLVPADWTAWELRSWETKTRFSADLSRMTECDANPEEWAHGRGKTPALALCAASLRARAEDAI